MSGRAQRDGETEVRRAARVVALELAAASAILVVLVLAASLAFVLAHLEPRAHADRGDGPSTIDVGVDGILTAGTLIGLTAIALAGLGSWFATRRAVAPLARALRLQRSFVANASHELRTPVAIVDARLQYLQRTLPPGDPHSATISQLREDTARLTQIIGDLLASAESDAADASATTQVAPVVRLAVDAMRLFASDRAIVIAFDPSTDPVSSVPAAALHRCVLALLDNAVKYSGDGGHVHVELHAERGSAVVTVTDEGPGISGIAVNDVFDRFARGTPSVHNSAGSGIGLSLVKDAMIAVGGAVTVEKTDPTGTRMRLDLPKVAPRRGSRVVG